MHESNPPISLNETYLTPSEVADLFKVSPVTVRGWALDGRLVYIKTPGGHRRYKYSVVEKFAKDNGVDLQTMGRDSARLLIVDDDTELSEALSLILSTYHFEIETAVDGFEAGEKIHTFKPDVILLDLILPGVDGFETCQRIKNNELTSHIKVIAMTGHCSDENISQILKAGAEACLPKPVSISSLLPLLGVNELNQGA